MIDMNLLLKNITLLTLEFFVLHVMLAFINKFRDSNGLTFTKHNFIDIRVFHTSCHSLKTLDYHDVLSHGVMIKLNIFMLD